jgi:hypothetical protein
MAMDARMALPACRRISRFKLASNWSVPAAKPPAAFSAAGCESLSVDDIAMLREMLQFGHCEAGFGN